MQAGTSTLWFKKEGQSPLWRKYLSSAMQTSPKERHTFAGMWKKGSVLQANAEPGRSSALTVCCECTKTQWEVVRQRKRIWFNLTFQWRWFFPPAFSHAHLQTPGCVCPCGLNKTTCVRHGGQRVSATASLQCLPGCSWLARKRVFWTVVLTQESTFITMWSFALQFLLASLSVSIKWDYFLLLLFPCFGPLVDLVSLLG